jgi:hypothetical protein
VTPDDSLFESGEGLGAALTACPHDQLVRKIRAFLKGVECKPETRFVFEFEIVDRSQPEKRVGDLRACPFIDAPQHPLGFHENKITNEEGGVFLPKQTMDFPPLRFVILREKPDENVGIERDHEADRA